MLLKAFNYYLLKIDHIDLKTTPLFYIKGATTNFPFLSVLNFALKVTLFCISRVNSGQNLFAVY